MKNSWAPLLSGPLQDEARGAIEAILADVVATPRERLPVGILDGHAGYALFFDMAARAVDSRLLEEAGASLQRAAELFVLARERKPVPGLHMGLSGVGWAAARLAANHSGLDVEELCSATDEFVEGVLRQSPFAHPCDIRDGLAGLGLYALERMPHPSGRRLLELVVEKMGELASPVGDGISWPMPRSYWSMHGRDATFPRGLFSVGVAHGVPPALAVLAGAHAHGVAREKADALLEKGFRWMARLARPEGPPNFPFHTHGDEPFPDPYGRFSWCAGNPGIVGVLWWAAHVWGHAGWRARALGWASAVAREALERPAPRSSNLCCGTAGTAHVFHRLFRATGVPLFEEAAVLWLRHTLALRQPGVGVGGYLLGQFGQEPGRPVADLQFGSAGTALALIAAVSEVEPDWDQVFLFSLTPARAPTPGT
jgi:hypothetical protein